MDSGQPASDKEQPAAAENGQAPAASGQPSTTQSAPQDALSKTDDEINEEKALNGNEADAGADEEEVKKPGGIKAFFRKVNVYLLLFVLILIIVGVVTIVSFLNSKKATPQASIASQQLNQATLKQLANSNATVGSSAQTLTVQGNAVFSGQVLLKSDLNVAGNIQLGGSLQAPSLTVSGKTNLADTQISGLQVAQNATIQGITNVKDLNASGATSFSGPVTASQITVTKLVMSGNASLEVPNHISFTGATPGRTVSQAALGAGGTASINGSDTTGSISINSGTGAAAGCFINVTFNQPFTNPPHVIASPVGAAAGQIGFYVTRTNTGFSVCGNTAAPASQSFGFDYFVTN